MVDRRDVLELLCAALRQGPLDWSLESPQEASLLYSTAFDEGVHLLAAHRLWERGQLDERLAASLRQQVALEEIARRELQRVLEALAAAEVPALIIKGAALAYTHYPDPALRPRVDADLLIPIASRSAAAAALERLGYTSVPLTSGELVTHQAAYAREDGGRRHVVDLHWEVSDPQVFARALDIEELLAASVAVPALGDSARAPSPVHSLAVACVHRVAHHAGRDRLIWLYDIHIVAERLSEAERDSFVAFATEKRLRAVCRAGLSTAERCFDGEGTRRLLAAMGTADHAREPSAAFAERPMRKVDVLRSDLGELRGWGQKVALLREHLFPPAAYMRQKYSITNPALLPFLYAWRIVRGGVGWLRPPDGRD
jgi:hypothetical protein